MQCREVVLTCTTIPNQDKLEAWHPVVALHGCCVFWEMGQTKQTAMLHAVSHLACHPVRINSGKNRGTQGYTHWSESPPQEGDYINDRRDTEYFRANSGCFNAFAPATLKVRPPALAGPRIVYK